jgi:hypothetical protein
MMQLVSLCLRKNPQARPSITSIQSQLESMERESESPSLISAAGVAIAQEHAKSEAEAARKRTEQEQRMELAQDASSTLDFVIESMFKAIIKDAPIAERVATGAIRLGSGKLAAAMRFPLLPVDTFPNWRKNIICGAIIYVEQADPLYRGRSANLWFGELENPGEFRWWEIPYFTWRSKEPLAFVPFGVDTQSGLKDVDLAGSQIMHIVQQAAKPIPIDGEYAEDFVKRWTARLAAASQNRLRYPSHLPEG